MRIILYLFLSMCGEVSAGKNSLQQQDSGKKIDQFCEKKEKIMSESELHFVADLNAFIACCNNHLTEAPCDDFNELREYFFQQLLQEEKKKLDKN